MPEFTLEIVDCPECTAPAEVADRFVFENPDGPIEHAIGFCVLRHRFAVLVKRFIPAARPETVDGVTAQPGRANRADTRRPRPNLSLTAARHRAESVATGSESARC